mgnify:CR=1 FL=1
MSVSLEVDGSVFTFPAGWEVEKVDTWPEQASLTKPPFTAKACDFVAMQGDTLWLVEAKDYTYPGSSPPQDLPKTVALKVFHTLATLSVIARWGTGGRRSFSARTLQVPDVKVCLAVELKDGGRKLIAIETVLTTLQQQLKRTLRAFGPVRPVVSNSHRMGPVPWEVSRDPSTRIRHQDR